VDRSGRWAKTRLPYPPEFRLEAVRLLRSGGRTPNQLAAELGCSAQTLRNWLRQEQADRGERLEVLSSEERACLRELERETRVLRQGREILKRAAAFFAIARQEPTRRRFRSCAGCAGSSAAPAGPPS
jgi:transposase